MLANGEAEVTFKVTGAGEMVPWLMSWGPAVQVSEPQWLRDEIVKSLQETMKAYNL